MIARRRRVLALFFGALQLLVGSRVFVTSVSDAAAATTMVAMQHEGATQEHCPPPSDHSQHNQDQGCHAGPVCCIPILPLSRAANADADQTLVAIATVMYSTSNQAPMSLRAFVLPPATAPPVV